MPTRYAAAQSTIILALLTACGGGGGSSDSSSSAGGAASGSIVLSLVAARSSGVAPLAVFFDASGTTDTGVTSSPFHDLQYTWDFGDAGAGTWANGSRPGASKNVASGPVAAHVFETPGTYTVTLTAFDGTNTATTSTTITVDDPATVFAGTNTTCVGATTVPVAGSGGCPAGAAVAQQPSFTTAIASYALTGRRVLFRRGDTFSAATSAHISPTGPGIVGSFGAGAKPVVQMTGNSNTLGFSSRSTPSFGDWRVMDLEFDGMGGNATAGLGIDSYSGGIAQITVLRLTLRNFADGIGFGAEIPNWWNNNPAGAGTTGHSIDQLAIVDNDVVAGANTMYGGYNSGNRVAFLGNAIDNGGNVIGSHVTRFPYLNKAVIGHNSLSRPGADRHLIKLHAPSWVGGVPDTGEASNYSPAMNGDGYSQQVLISDNKFTDHNDPWSVAVAPQDSGKDERLRNIILERNLHVATNTTQVAQYICASNVTSRNNLFIGANSNSQSAIMITTRGVEPPPTNVRIYHNTHYSPYAVPTSQFAMINISDARVANVTIRNNLAYAPNALTPLFLDNAGASGLVASNNSTNSQVKSTSPVFAATPPAQNTDWTPQAGSYASDAGAGVPVWSDFFLNPRPVGAAPDLGAIERQ